MNGKGSKRRPQQIDDAEMRRRWADTFGPKWKIDHTAEPDTLNYFGEEGRPCEHCEPDGCACKKCGCFVP